MIVWIDTETTGLSASKDRLLEIAVVVTDDALVELARYHAVTSEALHVNWNDVDPYVKKMHADNGLWGESISRGIQVGKIDLQLADFLANITHGQASMPQLGGSTVSFDRGFIERHLPHSAKYLHYRNLDVTSVNELARRSWKEVHDGRRGDSDQDTRRETKNALHRAMPDILESLRCARYYRDALGPVKQIENDTAQRIARWLYETPLEHGAPMIERLITGIVQGDWRTPS